jgi:hypothetical protein
VREVPDYAANQAAAAPAVAAAMANAHAAGYTRYLELLPNMYEEHCMADYDMDSEDEDWLRKVNSKVGAGARRGCGCCLRKEMEEAQLHTHGGTSCAADRPRTKQGVELP